MKELTRLFSQITKEKLLSVEQLSASGSNRHYYRLKSNHLSVIGVQGTSIEENHAYIEMSRHFLKQGLPVPQLLVVSSDEMFYLQEDMGNTLLFDYIKKGRETGIFSHEEKEMLCKTIQKLPEIQLSGAKGLDFSICYPQPEFNERSVFWDLNYFKYYFLKPSGTDFQENRLEDEFVSFSKILLDSENQAFMYRDFQSRNVMIKNGEPYFIDFQGGRKGPVYYDVASFLWQAKANYPEELREELLQVYLHSLKQFITVDEKQFRKKLNYFILFRLLQVLGAYGFRGYFERKAHFLESIPFALNNLKTILQQEFTGLTYLTEILNQMIKQKQTENIIQDQNLTVTVYSFSYKKGIPEDASGNGGGFVYDCRAIHNPRKYEEYKSLTGLDSPVIQFLEKDGGILHFLENVYELADVSVDRYMKRGFTNLMISFGCTGGQHRSVYSAQKTAEHIHNKFGIKVRLIHREQGIKTILNNL